MIKNSSSPIASAQDGFTIVEVMIAAVVLIVGLLGTLAMLDGASLATVTSSERVGATNVARELTEKARALDYDDLTPASLVSSMQANGAGSGAPWTIVRRNVSYVISASVCTFDSPADGLAASMPASVCTPRAAGANGDPNGDDFRRVSFTVSWRSHGTAKPITQTELIVNPSGGLGPQITNVDPLSQTIGPGNSIATVKFTTSAAATLHWQADDGRSQGSVGSLTGSPPAWRVDWPLGDPVAGGEVLDGPYQIIAQAFDDRAVAGDAKLATIVINRRRAYAPATLAGGHNTRAGDWVDLAWALNAERDIAGYRVYWAGPNAIVGNADDVLVCPAAPGAMLGNSSSSCVDPSPQSGGSLTYYVVAIDRDSSTGAFREGDPRQVAISGASSRPAAPAGPLTAALADGVLTLGWQPAAGAIFYRIYRDGTAIGDRYDRTAGSATTWSGDAPAGGHKYWITTVDSSYNESDAIGPVS